MDMIVATMHGARDGGRGLSARLSPPLLASWLGSFLLAASPAPADCIRHRDGHIVTCSIAGSQDAPAQNPSQLPPSPKVRPECVGLSGAELERCHAGPANAPQPMQRRDTTAPGAQ
jgi:hypothetical protein